MLRNRDHVLKWITKNNLKAVIHLAAIVPIKDVNNNKKKAKDVNFLGLKISLLLLKNQKLTGFSFHLLLMFINHHMKRFLKEAKKIQFLIMGEQNY